MKVVFLGCTKFSEELLKIVWKHPNVDLQAIFTIPEKFNISYSKEKVTNTNYADLLKHAKKWGIPHFEVESKKGEKLADFKEELEELKPDVILVMGWYYMIPSNVREIAKYGAWGIHASLLPKYAGGAPLVWAIIKGERKTGVSLFQLSEGIDDGDIIEQQMFPVEFSDTIKEVYAKATEASKQILSKVFDKPNSISFTPQDKSKIQIYPQRKPEDGEIDLSWDAHKIYDFIRAQSAPYPGAFIKTDDGKKLIIEKARVEDV